MKCSYPWATERVQARGIWDINWEELGLADVGNEANRRGGVGGENGRRNGQVKAVSDVDVNVDVDDEVQDARTILEGMSPRNREWFLFSLCVGDDQLIGQVQLGIPVGMLVDDSVDDRMDEKGKGKAGEKEPAPGYLLGKTPTPKEGWLLLLAQLDILNREDKDSFLLTLITASPELYARLVRFQELLRVGGKRSHTACRNNPSPWLLRASASSGSSQDSSHVGYPSESLPMGKVAEGTGFLSRALARELFEIRAKERRASAVSGVYQSELGSGEDRGEVDGSGGRIPFWVRREHGVVFEDLLADTKNTCFFPTERTDGIEREIAEFWIEETILRALHQITGSADTDKQQDHQGVQLQVSKLRGVVELAEMVVTCNKDYLITQTSIVQQLAHVILGLVGPMPHSAAEVLRTEWEVVYALVVMAERLRDLGLETGEGEGEGEGVGWRAVMADLGKYASWMD